VYQSAPDAPSQDSLVQEFNRLAGQVYVGLRDGTLNTEMAFDLACFLMEWAPADPVVRELAEESVAGTDPGRLAGLARRTLEVSGFGPGFGLEPQLLAPLERALEAVQADMRATGLDGPVRLVVQEGVVPGHAFAEFRGWLSCTSGIAPRVGIEPVEALVAVADDVQDAAMDALFTVWPVCPAHELGGHPGVRDGAAVWWCNGGGGHVAASIGGWAAGSATC
jgi:hypothetical protein